MPQYITFNAHGQAMCIDIAAVREITHVRDVTPAQLAPDYVLGLMNLRGQVVTMFDLANRLGTSPERKQGGTCLILKGFAELARLEILLPDNGLQGCEGVIGLAVDSVGDVIDVTVEAIAPVPANIPAAQAACLEGVARANLSVYPIVHVGRLLALESTI